MDRLAVSRALSLGVLVVVLAIVIFRLVYIDLYLTLMPRSGFHDAYVSDELWYVTGARNILVKIFGVEVLDTRVSSYPRCTLVFKARPSVDLVEKLCSDSACRVLDSGYSGVDYATATISWDNGSTTVLIPVGDGLNAVYIEAYNGLSGVLEKATGMGLVDYICGWALPDKAGINNYLNLEHPPLGKYIIALGLLAGDNPLTWRLPSILATTLLFLLGYLVTLSVLKPLLSEALAYIVATATPVLMLLDNTYFTIGALAMLDPYLSLFTMLGVLLLVRGGYSSLKERLARVVVFSLAGCIKVSGVFTAIGDFVEGFLSSGDTLSRVRNGFSQLLLYFTVYPLTLLLLSAPIIASIGFTQWYNSSITSAIKWHTSTKPSQGAISSPLDWLLGYNSFPLWYDPLKDSYVRCSGLPPLYLATLILGLALLPWILRQDGIRRVWLSYTSILLGYSVLYILGNKSLFSFYIIQFTPVATTTLVALTAYISKTIAGKHVIRGGSR